MQHQTTQLQNTTAEQSIPANAPQDQTVQSQNKAWRVVKQNNAKFKPQSPLGGGGQGQSCSSCNDCSSC